MSGGSGILVLIAIWCTIHILSYISTRRSSILPAGINYQHRNSRRRTRVSLHSLHLKISTTTWNTYHDTLSSFLARRGKHRINILFKLTYDLGTVFGAVGIVVAVAALFWICTSSAWTLLQKTSLARDSNDTSDISHLMKREISESSLHASSPYLEITPIVSQASPPFIIILQMYFSADTRSNSPTRPFPHNLTRRFHISTISRIRPRTCGCTVQ